MRNVEPARAPTTASRNSLVRPRCRAYTPSSGRPSRCRCGACTSRSDGFVNAQHPVVYGTQPVNAGARLIGAAGDAPHRHLQARGDVSRRRRLAPADRIRIIYYGIDASRVRDRPAARARSGDYGYSGTSATRNCIVSRCPGRATRHSSMPPLVCSQRAELRMLIAGEGPERGALESRAAREFVPGVVSFVGFQDYVREFLAACDLFVIPTSAELGEGFGLAALEAMAAGRPVIATAADRCPRSLWTARRATSCHRHRARP